MKRFVDVRGQLVGGCFAWWDTVIDMFEMHGDTMAWDTWEEFEEYYEGTELERYRRLTPTWAFKNGWRSHPY